MKLILTCATALSLLAGAALAETWKTIRKEADFVAAIAGKQLTWDGGKGILNADGTTSGTSKRIGK